MLGGSSSNSLENVYHNFPLINDPSYSNSLKKYYLLTFGYHIYSMNKLLVTNNKSKRADFMEMFLHHILTLVLYFIGYMTNWTKTGSLIMFLHDWADIPTSLVKCTIETTY